MKVAILKGIAGLILTLLGLFLAAYADSINSLLLKKAAFVFAFAAAIYLLAVPLSHWVVRRMVRFHTTHNVENINKNPLRFVINNKNKVYKWINIVWSVFFIYTVVKLFIYN